MIGLTCYSHEDNTLIFGTVSGSFAFSECFLFRFYFDLLIMFSFFCSCYFHSLCTMHDLLTYNLKIGRWCISIWFFFSLTRWERERERDDAVMHMTYFFVKTFLKGYVSMESRISYFCTHMLFSVFDDNHNSYNGFVILLFLLVIQNFFMLYCDLFHGRSILRNFKIPKG